MRRFLLILLCVNGVVVALEALVVVVGMAATFRTPFVVENRTPTTIMVTPLGSIGGPERYVLPLLRSRRSLLPAGQLARFEVAPRQAREFLYDSDDIQLTELLVEANGRRMQLTAQPPDGARGAARERLVIDDLDRLEPLSPGVAAWATASSETGSNATVVIILLLPVGSFLALAAGFIAARRSGAKTPA